MYKILVNSIENYIDGSNVPKIAGNVSAWYWDNTMPATLTSVDSETGLEFETINDGIHLADLSIAFDAVILASVINKETPEEAKLALNEFVISEARRNPLMSLDNLKHIKETIEAQKLAKSISQSIINAINPLVIWPARIEYPEE